MSRRLAILALCLVAPVAMARQFPSGRKSVFKTLASFPTGSTDPQRVIAADVDRDGIPDLVTATTSQSLANGVITVLRGRGDRTFVAPEIYTMPGPVYGLVVGDVTGDGFPDLVVAGAGVSIVPNLGDGTFGDPVVVYSSGNCYYPAIGALRAGGPADIAFEVVQGAAFPTIAILPGHDDGTFDTPITVTPPALGTIRFADIDGDGYPDLVVGPSILYGDSAEGLTPSSTTTQSGISGVGDFNGDGRLDLVTADSDHVTLSTHMNLGNRAFADATITGAPPPDAIEVADLDHDGYDDVITVSYFWSCLSVFRGSPTGLAPDPTYTFHYPSGWFSRDVALADFDGDGNTDAAVVNGDDWNCVTLLFGMASGEFDADQAYFAGWSRPSDLIQGFVWAAGVGDFDGNGTVDIVGFDDYTYDPFGTTMTVLLNDGNGAFPVRTDTVLPFMAPAQVLVDDFDRDGKLDLLLVGTRHGWFMRGHGDGSFDGPIDLQEPYFEAPAVAADFNGDGILDVFSSRDASVLLGRGDGTFEPPITNLPGQSFSRVYLARLNDDNLPDVVIINPNKAPGRPLPMVNVGGGEFAPLSSFAGPYDSDILGVADMDHDGLDDVIGRTFSTKVLVNRNLGDGQFDRYGVSLPTGFRESFWNSYAFKALPSLLTDLDDDGNSDLIAGPFVLFGNGTGGFDDAETMPTTPYDQYLAADLDGDGVNDVVAFGRMITVHLTGKDDEASAGSPITLSVDGSPTTVDSYVTLSADTTNAPIAVEPVVYRDGAEMIGVGEPGASVYPYLGAGDHPIVATQSADRIVGERTSDPVTASVTKKSLDLVLTNVATMSGHELALLIDLEPTPYYVIPTGTISLNIDGVLFKTYTINSAAISKYLVFTEIGDHTLTAEYSGDSNYDPAVAAPLVFTATDVATPTITPSANPAIRFQPVTLEANVDYVYAGGTVTFYEGSTALATSNVVNGIATTTVDLPVGTHTIHAEYAGDGYVPAESIPAIDLVVDPVSTSVEVSSSASPSVEGDSIDFTVSMTPATAEGTATLYDGTTSLGSQALTGGTATFTIDNLAAGEHSITASFTGTVDYASSDSPAISQTIQLRGDATGDNVVNAGDVFYLVNYLFAGGPAPVGPADANGDGVVNAADVFYLVNYLFAGGPPPPSGG